MKSLCWSGYFFVSTIIWNTKHLKTYKPKDHTFFKQNYIDTVYTICFNSFLNILFWNLDWKCSLVFFICHCFLETKHSFTEWDIYSPEESFCENKQYFDISNVVIQPKQINRYKYMKLFYNLNNSNAAQFSQNKMSLKTIIFPFFILLPNKTHCAIIMLFDNHNSQ